MTNGERDNYERIRNYLRRVQDGGPILIPDDGNLPCRHVYVEDVARTVADVIESGKGRGRAFNLSQDETVSLEEILGLIAEMAGAKLTLRRLPRERLTACHLLPACPPFSGRLMPGLANRR